MILQPARSSSESQVAGACPSSSGSKAGLALDRMPSYHRATPRLRPPGHNTPNNAHGLGMWEVGGMEHPEKTHLDMGRMCKFCTVVPARGIFFFS